MFPPGDRSVAAFVSNCVDLICAMVAFPPLLEAFMGDSDG
jgi:hypothetical protein